MQREMDDINNEISEDDLHEMEERRIDSLDEAGIDEQHVLTRAVKAKNVWNSYYNENVTRGQVDVDFVFRDQWTNIDRQEFTRLGKIALTFNKLYDSVKKVVGEQRRNKPDLIVRSLTGKSSEEQLDIRGDLIRTFCYQSQTDLVYQAAFKSALTMGFGAFQVLVDYETPMSFNKTVRYDLIADPTMCAWDPIAMLPHKGDGNYASRLFYLSRDEFFATYPYISNPVSFIDPYMLANMEFEMKDTICLCDEYVKEWYPKVIVKLSNGMSVSEEEWEDAQKMFHEQQKIVEGSIVEKIIKNGVPHVTEKRQTQDYHIMHYRMIRDRVIDFEEWKSKQLPIIFVDGDSYYIKGKQYTKSFIHEAKDAQKCINFFNSEIASEIKNRRREQWLGTQDNIAGQEQIWRNPEVQVGILTARPDPKTGAMPMKQQPWDVSPAIMQNAQRASQDVREILGFSEQEELQGRDVSGKARRERKLEGGMSAYVFFDNLNQAIAQSGRIVNDLLPYIIGTDERHLTVSKPDGKTTSMIFNHMQKDGKLKNVLEDGEFDVEIDSGPSFAVQKEIALEFLQQTLQANPQVFNLVADLWAKNLDVQFMPQLVERLKTMVPPEIIAKEEGKPPPPSQPNPQQMMMQHQMQMQQQEMQNKQMELKQKSQQLQLDAQQHLMDREKLKQDAIDMLHKMSMSKDKNDIEKQKAILELTKIINDSKENQKDRDLDWRKASIDHDHKMINLLHTINSSDRQTKE